MRQAYCAVTRATQTSGARVLLCAANVVPDGPSDMKANNVTRPTAVRLEGCS